MSRNQLRWYGHVKDEPNNASVRQLEECQTCGIVRKTKQNLKRVIGSDMILLGIEKYMVLDKA